MAKRMYDSAIVSTRLKSLRTQNKLTQKELAEKSGIPLISIKQYETGRRIPDLYNLNLLCNIFQVSSDYILGMTKDKESGN